MKIYHGSKSNFKEFDLNMIRTNATTEGVGFYCTDNKSIAERYAQGGYLLEFEYCGKKTLSSEKVTLTKDEMLKYILAINVETDFLSNYGDVEYEGYSKVLRRAINSFCEYSRDDVEFVSEICNTCGDFEMPLNVLYKTLGYDSAIVKADWGNQNIYLIFTNEAIKHVCSYEYLTQTL